MKNAIFLFLDIWWFGWQKVAQIEPDKNETEEKSMIMWIKLINIEFVKCEKQQNI